MSITQSQMQHLAYLRYLQQLAADQARLPEPMSSTSILLLHDAAESLLMLAAEQFNLPDSHDFMKYWDLLEPKLGERLPVEQGMKRLNNVRKELKHRGVQPNRRSIERALADTGTFLSSSVQMVLDVDLSSVSMTDLIGQDLTRQLAQEAEEAASSGDLVTAMIRLCEAFDQLFAMHQPADGYGRGSDFSFGPPLGEYFSFKLEELGLEKDFKQLIAAIMPIQVGVRMAVLGIDFAAYRRFDRLTPQRSSNFKGGNYWRAPQGYAPNQEAFDFCMQFVVTASLRLADAEAQVVDPPWTTRDAWGRVDLVTIREEPSVTTRNQQES